ncbi:MAG: ABC-type multidrug transport system, ATPase and permease component [Herbinix sp.]|nr:ABC-type multidrug transport system, ATPase and permease component [Herbinix sp.]
MVNAYWLDFNRLHSADYVFRLTQDAAAFTSGIVDDIPSFLSSAVKFAASFCVLAYYQPMIAVFTFVFGPIAFFITRFYSKKIKRTYQMIKEYDSEINEKLQENFQNLPIIKVFHLEELSSNTIENIYHQRKNLIIKNAILNNIMNIIRALFSWGGYFLAYSVGILGIYNGTISLGVIVIFLQLFNQIQQPMAELAGSIPKMLAFYTSAERLVELEKLNSECDSHCIEIPSILSIEMVNVNFSYPGRENQLTNINLRADAGNIVLIMGKSGSGKTTLIRLILSLIKPDQGEIIFYDGQNNPVKANAGNRQWITYVPQGNSLFSGTIADNIRYGNPSATDEEIISALTFAQAWDFVSTLRDGINSVIKERGVGISEGQAQRIAIARALVHKAPAIIFDEVTSGLDAETEKCIMETMKRDFKHKTLIVITHREAVKEYADKIYRMHHGSLIQE